MLERRFVAEPCLWFELMSGRSEDRRVRGLLTCVAVGFFWKGFKALVVILKLDRVQGMELIVFVVMFMTVVEVMSFVVLSFRGMVILMLILT